MNLAFTAHLQEKLSAFLEQPVFISATEPIAGGDINHSFLVKTSAGNYFIKHNSVLYGLDFFEKEAKGLELLASANALPVPKPLFHGQFHQQLYLVLEYFSKGETSTSFWHKFGEGLAALHRKTWKEFGLDHDNYIGSLHQTNQPSFEWSAFYFHQRIGKLIMASFKRGNWNHITSIGRKGCQENFLQYFPGSLLPSFMATFGQEISALNQTVYPSFTILQYLTVIVKWTWP